MQACSQLILKLVTVEPDRGEAIALLKSIAENNDVVVAGKGHEDYQILKDKQFILMIESRQEKYLPEV